METKNVGNDAATNTELPPELPRNLSQDEQYFALLVTAIRKCKTYKPKFGTGRGEGVTLQTFTALYAADPFYHWLGLDSPLMYAAHKAAGGMTSVYRQIGIGSQWILYQMLQDHLGLSTEDARWSYTAEGSGTRDRQLSLDGRIELASIRADDARARVKQWMQAAAADLKLPDDTLAMLKGVVFEMRQGYKSKDSKRQNADLANAAKAYAHRYMPVLLLFSTQIDNDVARRYKDNLWLLLSGSISGTTATSTYIFCREVIGYDLANFFSRYSARIKVEVEDVLKTLLAPEDTQ